MNTAFDTRPVFTTRRKELEWNRIQAVKMYRKGMSAANIAAIFEVTPHAVLLWMATFLNHGQNRLVAKKVSGRPPNLNAEQLCRLVFLVREYCPNQLSFDFGLWTLRLFAQIIERELGSSQKTGRIAHQVLS